MLAVVGDANAVGQSAASRRFELRKIDGEVLDGLSTGEPIGIDALVILGGGIDLEFQFERAESETSVASARTTIASVGRTAVGRSCPERVSVGGWSSRMISRR